MTAVRKRNASVVEAKLYPGIGTGQPLTRPGLDPPSALVEGSASVAVICAPAGYGKSMVMAHWHDALRASGVACAWLSLEPDDNDTARFLRYLVAAFQNIHGDLGRDVLAQLTGSRDSIKPLLESLAADLGRVPGRAVLFIDDIHFAKQDEILEVLHWLINYSPRQFQYVLGSRLAPRLQLSGLRVRRRLLEIGTRDLEFTADEARQFFEIRLGAALPDGEIQQLMQKTEGWPAALELVAAALKDQAQRSELIAHFTGTDRSVVDYLGEMVLGSLDARLRSFVERVAQFDRVNAALAARISGVPDAAHLLAELHTRNLFLIPLDRHGEWYRFHHLVGHFFREHARRTAPVESQSCLIAGAHWLFEHGFIEEAISCAIRAKAWAQATDWVALSVEELIHRRGYHQTLMHWMQELPEEWVDQFPTIRINYAFTLAFDPRQREVEAQLHRLGRIVERLEAAKRPDAQAIAGIRCAVELQVTISHALRDQGIAARDCAQKWLERWPDAPALQKGHVANALAFGHKTASDIAAGLAVVAQGRQWHQQGEGYYGLAWNVFVEAMLHMKRGSYHEARQVCQSGLEMIERQLNGHRGHSSLLHTVLAAVAYEFDEADQAVAHIEQSMHSIQDYGPADAMILAYLTQARLQFLQRDAASAYAILHEGQAQGARRELSRVVVTLAAEECTWLGRHGRNDEAREVALRCGILGRSSEPVSGLIADKASRVALRIGLHDSPGQALKMLTPAIEHSAMLGLHHRRAELLALKAVAHKLNGELPLALGYLNDALLVAASRQYLRTFLDEGQELASLLEQMVAEHSHFVEVAPLARRLLRSIGKARQVMTAGTAGSHGSDALFGELTKREIGLLKHLESGMSNREIAESIFISEGTLRWHLHNIYGKLGTKNRSGALVKARSMNLI